MSEFDSKRKVGFYIRVSTERQAKVKEGSLKNQKQMLIAELNKRNMQYNNWGELIEIYVDEGISGKDINRPAFQKMLNDIRMGKIDTVMFTELTRLSRSLKDFLNIFEFTQKFNCDLICLKTDIDTTTPYKNLITKILMVVGEFEREITSQRTSINAYERSKRGLANGGYTPFGYKRDTKNKGYFLVDKKEAKIVQEIFKTYLKEKSIKKTLEKINLKYPDLKFKRNKIYTILTNKAYIGIREINKRDKSKYEEVKAVWESIIDESVFNQVAKLLKENRDKFHIKASKHFNYFLSGLFVCGKCGKTFHGESAYSKTHKRHYYYTHKCNGDGISRIDAEILNNQVLDWLKEISTNQEKFNQLQEQGIQRINNRIKFLFNSLDKLNSEIKGLEEEGNSLILELPKAKSNIVKSKIEKMIIELEKKREEIKEKQIYIKSEIEELKEILKQKDKLFNEYKEEIQKVLASKLKNELKEKIQKIISFVRLEGSKIKIALSSVNSRGLVRLEFASAPRDGLEPPT